MPRGVGVTSKLEEFQRNFAASIKIGGESSPFCLQTMQSVGSHPGPEKALRIYRDAYEARHRETLGENFPATWKVLGDETFFRLATTYIAANPSQSYNLNDYGALFPQFLQETEAALHWPFLVDLARFEYFFQEVFHLPWLDEEILDLNAFVSEGRDAALSFQPACRVLPLAWDIYPLWQQRHDSASDAPDPEARQDFAYLLYKREGRLSVKALQGKTLSCFQKLLDGVPLFSALELSFTDGTAEEYEEVQSFFYFLGSSQLILKNDPE